MIVSSTQFLWFNTFMVAAICVGWGIRDLITFLRILPERKTMHDEFFGVIMGMLMSLLGVIGMTYYHLTL